MKCPECHHENPSKARTCQKCGLTIESPDAPAGSPTRTVAFPRAALPRGTILADRFEVIEILGQGGMGSVYRVLDKTIDEDVALKILKPEIAVDATAAERFRNELKYARKITHQNVCRVYDFHDTGGMLFITMEFVAGEDLKKFIRREGCLAVPKAAAIAGQICDGLEAAHRLNVVHRDLKPQNIMVDGNGNVRIMDFGIARLQREEGVTRAGLIVGTPEYMSPEQVAGEKADERSDIYSLGIVLYEMVAGRVPFSGDSALAIGIKHKTEPPLSPSETNDRIPPEFSRLILRCLEKNPEKRYQAAAEIRSDLLALEKGAPPTGTTGPVSASAEERRSIAVLPFKDMSPQRDQDFFCEGLAEELINALTKVQGLKVAARTSAFSFKDKDADVREIGTKLDVGTVLEGSIQKSGNRVRITVQLINVADGYHLWSERFDRSLKDIFAVQDEISLTVVEKLKVELLEEEREKITKRHTRSETAYKLYLKGRYFWNRRYQGDMIRAVDYYQRAIDKDPDYALAYVAIADVFNILGQWAFIHPREAYLRTKDMLQKALALDDSLSEIYSSLAFMTQGYERDFPAVDNYMRRSIELNPHNAYAHVWYAVFLGILGRKSEMLAEAEKAIEIDPLFSLLHALRGLVLALSGDVEKGREIALKALAMDPDQPMVYLFLGFCFLSNPADPEKAAEYLEKAMDSGLVFASGWLSVAYGFLGREQDIWNILKNLDEIEKQNYIPPIKKLFFYVKPGLKHFLFMKKKYISPLTRALIYVGLNDEDKAMSYLEKSAEIRDYFLSAVLELESALIALPSGKKFRSHPRFQALKARYRTN